MAKLSGKIAAVTGGAQGIGREIALLFAREGAEIAIIDRNQKNGEEVAEKIRSLGQRSFATTADVGEEDEVDNAFTKAENECGSEDCSCRHWWHNLIPV